MSEMRIGNLVRVKASAPRRRGELGEIIGREKTMLGWMWRVQFENGEGLFEEERLMRLIPAPTSEGADDEE